MFFKRIIFFLILGVFYQNPSHSKSNSLNDFDGNNLSKYFSGIVALENKDNTRALQFLSSSKILLNKHNPYLKKYVLKLRNTCFTYLSVLLPKCSRKVTY